MRRMSLIVSLAMVLFPIAPAVGQDGGPASFRRGAGPRTFDPATVTTVSGEIVAINRVQYRRGAGVHLDLKTSDGVLDVHLGPARYVEAQPMKLTKGDAGEVTGSQITLAGKPAIVAQTVKKGGAILILRDASGTPAWSRRPRR
jgi:hypothetical protein